MVPTDDPTLISEGLESLRRILAEHYVHRNQAELVKSMLKERGTHKESTSSPWSSTARLVSTNWSSPTSASRQSRSTSTL